MRYAERAIVLSPQWTGVNADRAMYLVAWRGDVTEGRRVVQRSARDGGAVIGRLRFHAAMLVGSDAADSSVLRKLTAGSFNGDDPSSWSGRLTGRTGTATRRNA